MMDGELLEEFTESLMVQEQAEILSRMTDNPERIT
jgi:hypothetical protein